MKTTINFRIEAEFKDDLEIIAEESNKNISSLIREIIIEYIDVYYFEEKVNEVITMTSVHSFKNLENE